MKTTNTQAWRATWNGGRDEKWFDDFYEAVSFYTQLTNKYATSILEYHRNNKCKIIFNTVGTD